MKINSLAVLVLYALVTATGCNSNGSQTLTREDFESYSPVPMENAVILETDDGLPLRTILSELQNYQAAYVNSICVRLPLEFKPADLHALVDSCHQAGINVIVHAAKPDGVRPELVRGYNVDGYHCTQASLAQPQQWQSIADSLYAVKPMLLVADDGSEALKDAGFSAAAATEFTAAVDDVLARNAPTSHLDSVFLGEKFLFSRSFPAVRRVKTTGYDPRAQTAALVTLFAAPGVPCFDAHQIVEHDTLLKTLLNHYTNSAVLQYGDVTFYDAGSADVFTAVRDFQGKKVLFAVNMRNRPAAYKWPTGMTGGKVELMMGEKLEINGGQELGPYGYQIFKFESIDGFNALQLRTQP